ncbi:SDR family oxidoreductase [Salibaculum griseiflavum]|uniref:3-oxoacyl-[acyl-carrier-protein] reductase n=1 Tax=Salibaculum griseiflavum TaxID=1914409 RepID=A0A2V1P2G1_9RHOB|nr:SDR family oxidoreductase [Salibaculum griseiflavum]PWG16034.1 3-oxoacyl-[acyl-carrier-protein] reductase [Salibaculum griseiflavum]
MRRVLITGGASGIGRAMAEAFADEDCEVWVTDVDERLLADCPATWRTRMADAAEETAIAAVIDEIGMAGGLDVLCANAGVKGPTAPIEKVALDDWRACTAVTLDGAFLVAKYAAPLMKAAGRGVMLFTSSTAGIYGYPNRSPYAAAKWGVIGLMKTVAMELGPHGIRANAILPGAVEGPRMERVLEAEAAAKGMTRDAVYEGYAAGVSLKTFVEAADVADMAVFLASDRARRISGQAIAVDGHTVNPDPQV